ncbi:hypothetical protein ACWGB8_32885 [Kitasatospora sp. NPDC054939]
MIRRTAWTLTLLAAAGIATVPTAASADVVSGGNHGVVVVGSGNQIAGYDIINAGHDATVGSYNGTSGDDGGKLAALGSDLGSDLGSGMASLITDGLRPITG